jgi:hypothetical protein
VKRLLLVFMLVSVAGCIVGQETISVSGQVVDAATSKPLPFAQVSLSSVVLGTVTNEEGRFSLNVPSMFRNDTVQVSYLGYDRFRMTVSQMPDAGLIRLKPLAVQLHEVEIASLTPQEVLRRVMAHLSENYGADSLLLTVFLRSQKFLGTRMAEYTEAILEDLKTGYRPLSTKKESDKAHAASNVPSLVKGRVISDTNLVNSMGDVGVRAGCMSCMLMNDVAENNFRTILDGNVFDLYTLKMEEQVAPGGKIYHIWYDQKAKNQNLYSGELFVDASSWALVKYTLKPSFNAFDHYEKEKYKKSYVIRGTPGWIAEMPLLNRTILYTKQGDRWYLSTIREEQYVTFTQPASGQKIRAGYKNDVVVTGVTRDPETLRNFHGDKKAGTSQRWDQIAGPADESFWAKYNYLPVEEKLKEAIGHMTR